MPPPITSIVFGRARNSRAPVESTTRASSGRNGSRTGWLPAAMTALSKRTTCFSPLRSWPSPRVISTSRWFGSRKRPTPRTTWTLRAFAMPASPPVIRPTTFSFQARSLSRSICGSPKPMPWAANDRASSMTPAACRSAFDGMQPTLRQTPPRVA